RDRQRGRCPPARAGGRAGSGIMTAVLDQPAPTAEAPARPAPRRSRAALWATPPLLIVLVAAAYPLLRVCLESTKASGNQSTWSGVLASQMFRDALWRTVAIAVTSTAGCLVLGMFLAVVLAFVPFPGSRVVGRLIDTVLALPSFLVTLAFTFLYGSAGAVNAAISSLTGATSP